MRTSTGTTTSKTTLPELPACVPGLLLEATLASATLPPRLTGTEAKVISPVVFTSTPGCCVNNSHPSAASDWLWEAGLPAERLPWLYYCLARQGGLHMACNPGVLNCR